MDIDHEKRDHVRRYDQRRSRTHSTSTSTSWWSASGPIAASVPPASVALHLSPSLTSLYLIRLCEAKRLRFLIDISMIRRRDDATTATTRAFPCQLPLPLRRIFIDYIRLLGLKFPDNTTRLRNYYINVDSHVDVDVAFRPVPFQNNPGKPTVAIQIHDQRRIKMFGFCVFACWYYYSPVRLINLYSDNINRQYKP